MDVKTEDIIVLTHRPTGSARETSDIELIDRQSALGKRSLKLNTGNCFH